MKSNKPKKMKKGEFEAARKALYDSYGGVKKRSFKDLKLGSYEWKDRSSESYSSLEGKGFTNCGRTNMMEPMILMKESPEVQAAILAKASRLIPQFNKGAVQYTPESLDLSETGRKK